MNAAIALALVAVIVIAVYYILPKTRYASHRGNIMRAVVFFLLIAYLGWDFYQKEKYSYLIFLAVASVAVVYALRSSSKKEP